LLPAKIEANSEGVCGNGKSLPKWFVISWRPSLTFGQLVDKLSNYDKKVLLNRGMIEGICDRYNRGFTFFNDNQSKLNRNALP
jgi:hypothetical protein